MKYLGMDYGSKRIGLAISDTNGIIAQFYKTINLIKNEEKFFINLENIIKINDINAIVIGLPYHLNKDFGEKAKIVKLFGKKIEKRFFLPIFYEDERLTTIEANKILIQGNVKRKKRKEKIDSISAVIILQKFIDRKLKLSKKR